MSRAPASPIPSSSPTTRPSTLAWWPAALRSGGGPPSDQEQQALRAELGGTRTAVEEECDFALGVRRGAAVWRALARVYRPVGERISVIFVNNGIYGMTGGQMAPTCSSGPSSISRATGRLSAAESRLTITQ